MRQIKIPGTGRTKPRQRDCNDEKHVGCESKDPGHSIGHGQDQLAQAIIPYLVASNFIPFSHAPVADVVANSTESYRLVPISIDKYL